NSLVDDAFERLAGIPKALAKRADGVAHNLSFRNALCEMSDQDEYADQVNLLDQTLRRDCYFADSSRFAIRRERRPWVTESTAVGSGWCPVFARRSSSERRTRLFSSVEMPWDLFQTFRRKSSHFGVGRVGGTCRRNGRPCIHCSTGY